MSVGMPFGAFLAAVLSLVPLPSHWRARNVATLSIIAWLVVVNIIQGVNAIVWAHSIDIRRVSWCDIVIHVSVGSNIALPVACFCLCMNLERVASVRQARTAPEDKRRRTMVDLVLCLGVPLIYMGLFYIVQGHRFDIVEGFGCRPEAYVSIPEFFLMRLPPILFSVGTFAFAAMAFHHFVRRRASFALHLRHTACTLTPTRYFRLMAMALVEMFWSLLISVLNMWFSYRVGLRPWISWDNVHSDFSRIGQFPLILIPPETLTFTYFLWWTIPVSGYLFFAFFAFNQDSMKGYSLCLRWFHRVVFGSRTPQGAEDTKYPLPRFVAPKANSPSVVISDIEIDDAISTPPSFAEKETVHSVGSVQTFDILIPPQYPRQSVEGGKAAVDSLMPDAHARSSEAPFDVPSSTPPPPLYVQESVTSVSVANDVV